MFYIYKIYEIKNIEIFYIGSTNNFKKRKYSHKKNTMNKRSKGYSLKIYKYIRECGGWDNFTMEIYELIDTIDRKECLKREHEIVNDLKPSLNTNFNISRLKY